MRRLAVFVHYDKHDIVDPYVFYYLKQLNKVIEDIVFVTTSSISNSMIKELETLCNKIIVRDNIGYDFMSYKVGLESYNLMNYDEVLICNDSVYGPIYPLDDLFETMSKKICDFWGLTDSNQFAYHLQSYFLVFKSQVLVSNVFREFWDKVDILESKDDIIFQYEIGLSQKLIQANLKPNSFVLNDVRHSEIYLKILQLIMEGNFKIALREIQHFRLFLPVNCNITLWFWDKILIKNKMPFIKVAALRDNLLNFKSAKNYERLIQSVSSYSSLLIKNHINRMIP